MPTSKFIKRFGPFAVAFLIGTLVAGFFVDTSFGHKGRKRRQLVEENLRLRTENEELRLKLSAIEEKSINKIVVKESYSLETPDFDESKLPVPPPPPEPPSLSREKHVQIYKYEAEKQSK